MMRSLVNNRCQLGESPLWDHSVNVFYWIDLLQPHLHRVNSDLSEHVVFDLPAPLQCIGLYNSGTLMGISSKTLVQVEFLTGGIQFNKLADIEILDDVLFNDGKCDAAGRFWSGTKAKNHQDPEGKLFRFDIDGNIDLMDDAFILSNGLGWNLENTLFYCVDTMKKVIYVYDFDLEQGTITNKRIFVDFNGTDYPSNFLPDGLTIDSEGYVWVAIWGGSKVLRFDPSGQECTQVELSTANVTSCCFGGRDLTTLFITTANVNGSTYSNDLGTIGGCTFTFDNLNVHGVLEPECRYRSK